MSERIVHVPAGQHQCVVRFSDGDRDGRLPHDHLVYWARTGTVLECGCGRTFVAQPRRAGEMFPRWRREGWIARWRRLRLPPTEVPGP